MNSIVALPIAAALPVAAPGMAPRQAPEDLVFLEAAGSPADPVFAAIAKHRKALRALRVANAEVDRFLALADETVGPSSIEILDMREPSMPPGFHPYVEVNCWIDIEKFVAQADHPELHAHYLSKLEERSASRSKFLNETAGDIDEITDGPSEAEMAAADELADTAPTSLPGLLAMIAYVHSAKKRKGVTATFDEKNWGPLLASFARATRLLAQRTAS